MLFKAGGWVNRKDVLVVKTLRYRFISRLCHRLPAQHGISQADPAGGGRGKRASPLKTALSSVKINFNYKQCLFWKMLELISQSCRCHTPL